MTYADGYIVATMLLLLLFQPIRRLWYCGNGFNWLLPFRRWDADPDRGPMFANATNLDHPFSSITRIKLIMSIIQGDDDDCCSLNLRKMVKDGSDSLLKYFPIHDDSLRDDLERSWLAFRTHPWEQPIDDIKEYFGEKTAMYFEVGRLDTFIVQWC